jgi:hypothetical protein
MSKTKFGTRLLAAVGIAAMTALTACHRDSLWVDIDQPSATGAFTTNATSVIVQGHVGGWGSDEPPHVDWHVDTSGAHSRAFRSGHFYSTEPLGLVIGDNVVRIHAHNGWDRSADRIIVVTRTP